MNARPRLWAVVPAKLFADTKQRLASLLSPDERIALSRAMLEDVLAALLRVRSLAGVAVITADAGAADIARAAGALIIADIENTGTNAAVTRAAQNLVQLARSGMLVLPADVPQVAPEDVETIIAAHHAAPAVTLVPAGCDGGTNALAVSPPGAIRFHYGDDSFRLHCAAARSSGIEPQILHLDRLACDIDRPEDVMSFLEHPSPTKTYAYLAAREFAKPLAGAAGTQSVTRPAQVRR